MAKTSMIEREKRRAKVVKKYAVRRAKLKEDDPRPEGVARKSAWPRPQALQKLPRDSSPSRASATAARSRAARAANYSKFGLGAHEAARGDDARRRPGLRKASW